MIYLAAFFISVRQAGKNKNPYRAAKQPDPFISEACPTV